MLSPEEGTVVLQDEQAGKQDVFLLRERLSETAVRLL